MLIDKGALGAHELTPVPHNKLYVEYENRALECSSNNGDVNSVKVKYKMKDLVAKDLQTLVEECLNYVSCL